LDEMNFVGDKLSCTALPCQCKNFIESLFPSSHVSFVGGNILAHYHATRNQLSVNCIGGRSQW